MTDVRVTTIIPWCQRLELEQTLRHNAPIFAAMRSDVIVVNCGGDSDLLRGLLPSDVQTTQVAVPAAFNRSLAINIGTHCAEPGVVFILDADILLTASLRPYAEICAQSGCFGILAGMTSVPPRPSRFTPQAGSFLQKIVTEAHESYYWADGQVTKIILGRHDRESDRRTACGLILVRRQHLLEIGGYRSDFDGWGWEDMDVQARLLRHGLKAMLVDEEVKHLEHEDGVRDLKGMTSARSAAKNRHQAWRAYCEGQLSGTYEADVERWRSAISSTRSTAFDPAGDRTAAR